LKEEVVVMVRAIPEKTKNHGHLVCVAGITQDGELRRLYPFEFEYGVKALPFHKRNVIQVDVDLPDNDKRRESRKVKSFDLLPGKLEDNIVRERIRPLVTSIKNLNEQKASLGIVKPILEDIEVKVNSTEVLDKQTYFNSTGDYLDACDPEACLEHREMIRLPVEVRYVFKCHGEPTCKGHKIIIIDWELNELARNIMKTDKDKESIERKIKEKFFDFMKKRDLYLFLGTHFRFGTWLIIGIYYPPKKMTTLLDF
jgi:hypothetical protein